MHQAKSNLLPAVAMLFLLTAPAMAEPFYCKAFKLMERSCFSAKAMVKLYGEREAIAKARRCGATELEIAQARECLK